MGGPESTLQSFEAYTHAGIERKTERP